MALVGIMPQEIREAERGVGGGHVELETKD